MGFVWTVGLLGGLAVAAYFVAREGLRQPPGLPRGLASVVLGWTWLTVGVELLGSFGFLQRDALAGWVGLGMAVAIGLRVQKGKSQSEANSERPSTWLWCELVALGLVIWASSSYLAGSLLRPVKVVSDGPIYHLYFAARWWKAGRLFPVAAPFGENAATYFPAIGDVWFTWLMTAWGGDRLAKVGQAPFAIVAALTVFAIARRLGSGRTAALIATAWFFTSTSFFAFSFEPNVDTIFVAGYLLAAYFFLRFALGDDGLASLALGALAAGGALGTKAPAIVFVPPLLLLGALTALTRRSPPTQRLAGLAIVALLPFVTAGYWFARNYLWTGNPLYPLHLQAFGRLWLRGWYGPEVMTLSEYYLPVTDWRSLSDILMTVLDPRMVPFWFAAVLSAWAIGTRASRDVRLDRYVWVASGLAILNVALYWLVVPYRTQQRFMIQAIGLASVPLARFLDRSAWLRILGLILLGLHVVTPQFFPFGPHPFWDLSGTIPNAVPGLIPFPRAVDMSAASRLEFPGVFAVLAAPLTGLFAFLAAWASSRLTAGQNTGKARLGWAVATASSLTLLVLTAGVAAYPWAMPERLRPYPLFADHLRGWAALDRASGPSGARVAYAGTDIPYYLMADGLRNEVRYINVDTHRNWLLHDYHLAALADGSGPATWPYPRPGWDRAHPDYDAWLDNLRAEAIELLVVTRANPANGPHNVADTEGFPIERQWADTHPEVFEPIYGPAEGDRLFRLYRVRNLETPRSG